MGPVDAVTWRCYITDGVRSTKTLKNNEKAEVVGERGFEPPAPASRRQCSTRLSYSPTGSARTVLDGAGAKQARPIGVDCDARKRAFATISG